MNKEKKERQERKATYLESLLVVVFMLVVVTGGYIIFNLKVELLMIVAATFAAIMAYRIGISWTDMENAIADKLRSSMTAIFIIWSIGIVIGSFIFCGSIPWIIYLGLKMIHPTYLYLFAFLTCLVLSVVTGTSWGSAGTAGVALMGVAIGLDANMAITAAAVVCGSVFGDKMSPLSDTTNLSPICSGATLYEHIRSMCWTTFPSAAISAILFFIMGMKEHISGEQGLPEQAQQMIDSLSSLFKWNWVLIIPFLIILVGAVIKKPPVPTMIISAFVAIIIGVFYQGFSLESGFIASINGFTTDLISSNEVGDALTTLLTRGGMKSMVGIVVMIFAGYAFAGICGRAGFIEIVLEPLMNKTQSRGVLVASTLFTSFLMLCCSGITYVAFIICGDMFKKKYFEKNLHPRVLSRIMEDAATCMAPLVPWGTSGLYYASVLGVAVFGAGGVAGYAPYAFFTYLTPLISLIFGFTGIAMFKMNKEERKEVADRLNIVEDEEN